MSNMLLVRANYLDGNFQWKTGDIEIEDGRLLRVGENLSFPEDELAVDCSGYTIIPGFVDIHIPAVRVPIPVMELGKILTIWPDFCCRRGLLLSVLPR